MRSFTAVLSLALVATSVIAAPVDERATCSDVYVYFARGTTEVGTLGTVVGPGLKRDITIALLGRSVEFEGIDYPANLVGYLAGGDAGGARTMANSVTATAAACPNAKIVISGYSQGAQVTHLAARQLPAAIQNRINAVVTFGDPYEDTALPGVLESRRKTFCNFGDLICQGLSVILAPHLTYGTDTPAAAAFVKSKV
ncbi:cutinase [Agrocybe pediades]|nr:cutinase [Agrocybe pediades]